MYSTVLTFIQIQVQTFIIIVVQADPATDTPTPHTVYGSPPPYAPSYAPQERTNSANPANDVPHQQNPTIVVTER